MRFKIPAILIGFFCFFLAVSLANAFDYNDWIPLLPDSIGGLAKSGDPSGTNMEQEGESWSALGQEYSDDEGNRVSLTFVTGENAPHVQQFEQMQQFNMENEEELAKTVEVSGNNAFLQLQKDGSSGTLAIGVGSKTLVFIETNTASSEGDLKALADDLPLSDIANQTQ